MRRRGAALLLTIATLLMVGCAQRADVRGDAGEAPDGFAACPASAESASGHGEDENAQRLLPELSLPCMDGSGASFPLRRDVGMPMVINLWGSWCPPCGRELPAFVALHEAAAGKLLVMGVVTEDSATRAKEAGHELGVKFPNVYDRSGALRRALGVHALPVTLFVGASGELRKLYAGPVLDVDSLRHQVGRQLGVELDAGR